MERAYQLLAPGGIAIIVLPISLLSNPDMVSVKARELILKYFDIYAIVEFGTKTFGKTGTNTATLFMKKREENPLKVIIIKIGSIHGFRMIGQRICYLKMIIC